MKSRSDLSSSLRGFTRNRVIPSDTEIARAAAAVNGHMCYKRCSLFDKRTPTVSAYLRYIEKQPNIYYVSEDVGLRADTYGAVLKKRLKTAEQSYAALYLLIVSPLVLDPVERLFTIAHELGHILLHGSLLEVDLLTPRRSQRWYQSSNRIQPLIEVEANVFALYSLIPMPVLTIVYSILSPEERADSRFYYYAKQVLEEIYGAEVDVCMVEARVYLHRLLNSAEVFSDDCLADLENHSACRRARAWVVDGLASSKDKHDLDDDDGVELCQRTINRILTRLRAAGVTQAD